MQFSIFHKISWRDDLSRVLLKLYVNNQGITKQSSMQFQGILFTVK